MLNKVQTVKYLQEHEKENTNSNSSCGNNDNNDKSNEKQIDGDHYNEVKQ